MSDFTDRYVKENERLDALAKRLGNASIEQPIDPDGPAMRCGCQGCRRDAVLIIRVYVGSPREFGMTACRKHAAVARLQLATQVAK